jgi:hypothetical protein
MALCSGSVASVIVIDGSLVIPESPSSIGARIALIAGFSSPEGVDRSVFLFDIDACGFVEIVHAGVFDHVQKAATAWRALVG